MKKAVLFAAAAAAGLAVPAHATGGVTCRTAGPPRVEVNGGFGHVPGAPLILLGALPGKLASLPREPRCPC